MNIAIHNNGDLGMDFLFINTHELSALTGLPHIQQLTYLRGIRPHMDRKTFIVGIQRKISYQYLSEILYVEPHQGIQSGSPSKPQLRRVVKGLEQAGLIQIQSTRENLILKCLLANTDNSVENKPVTKPSSYSDIIDSEKSPVLSTIPNDKLQKDDIGKKAKAVIPHNSDNNFVFFSKNFEKFWSSYPQPQNKTSAWKEFQKLNPDEALFSQIITALRAQRERYQQLQEACQWQPAWKYPTNWLAQKCWNDALNPTKEQSNAKHERTHAKKSTVDVFWEACRGGLDFSFGEDEYGTQSRRNNTVSSTSNRDN